MIKKIKVKSDDPENRQFDLVITGKVDHIVKIVPSTVSLSGTPGQELKAIVTITPAEKYGFSILELSQKIDTQIQAELIRPKPGSKDWQVQIKASSDKADDLYDIITLKTDSPYKPKLKIRVYAIYMDDSGKKS